MAVLKHDCLTCEHCSLRYSIMIEGPAIQGRHHLNDMFNSVVMSISAATRRHRNHGAFERSGTQQTATNVTPVNKVATQVLNWCGE